MIPSEKINRQIKSLPSDPGVYQYYDASNVLIYVGKAKNLKRRIQSYFNKNHSEKKTILLVKKINRISVVCVKSELDALLLENNLIKIHKPKYNVLLKDDKTYPWICINYQPFPRVFQTRIVSNDGSEYYGPFRSTIVIKILFDFFSHLFYSAGWDPYDFLNHKPTPSNEKEYLNFISVFRKTLNGNLGPVFKFLNLEMSKKSKSLDFESAKIIKSNIQVLKNYQSKSSVVSSNIKDADVFSLVSSEKYAFVNYLKIVKGAIVRSHSLEMVKRLDEDNGQLLMMAITDLRQKFFSESKIIYSSLAIPNVWGNTRLFVPKIGDKRKLIELSFQNAKLLQKERLQKNELLLARKNNSNLLEVVKTDLNLKEKPHHIECFDNSNIQGDHAVGACVVFKNGRPKKSEYRIFNIKTVSGINDFASMEEIVFRRLKRLLSEKKKLPQLIIVDGGKGQLSSAKKSLDRLGLSNKLAIIGIAKRLETIFFPSEKTPLFLDKRSVSLRLIQRMRDEAHRFGIAHHRKKRNLSITRSLLTEIPGIGQKTCESLIKHFGSTKKVLECSEEVLAKIIGGNKARIIVTFVSKRKKD